MITFPTSPKPRINCIIVDDEKIACKNLQSILAQCNSNINVSGIEHNTKDAELLINDICPHVVFLDIHMPNENAFLFLERIHPRNFEVIFVTAYDEFAIRALRLNAVDYILKPICNSEIDIAIQRLTERLLQANNQRDNYTELATHSANKTVLSKITFKDLGTLEIVDFKDLFFIEAKGSYANVAFKKGNTDKSILISHSISEYEEILHGTLFFRIHKSYLVNCQHINEIIKEDNNYFVQIAGKFLLPVSRRRYPDLMLFLKSTILFQKKWDRI